MLQIGNALLTAPTKVVIASLDNTLGIDLFGGPVDSQTLAANRASLVVKGPTTGGGDIDLHTSADVELGGAVNNNVVFYGTNDILKLDDPEAGIVGGISGFAAGDTLDLVGEKVTIVNYDGTFLTVATATGTTTQFFLNGPKADDLVAVSDNNGGTNIIVVCFASGTSIRTARGDVAVEHLQVDDMVETATGAHRSIVCLGNTTVDCASHRTPEDAWPIRIRAGAFGEGRPARDLFLSPNHAVAVTCLSDILIPVKHLINGATIAQEPRDTVEYWHIELETHDIVLAENLPAESFLDTQGREFFEQMEGRDAAGEDLKTIGDFCRPLVTEGPIVDAVRLQLLARAAALGWTMTDEADVHILADNQVIRPVAVGPLLRFAVPAATRALDLVSRNFVPRESDVATFDDRRLGVPVRRLTIDDGLAGKRDIAVERLAAFDGFHPIQEWDGDRWLWTNGNASLPFELWEDCAGLFILDIEQATERGSMRAWCEPAPEGIVVGMAEARAARMMERRTAISLPRS